MTQQELLNVVRSLMINVSNRNCNLVDLGYSINNISLTQLQFLSLLEQCFIRYDLFNEEQINNLNNILEYVKNMEITNNKIYDTSRTILAESRELVITTNAKEEAILNKICLLLASYGGASLKECTASCSGYNQSAIGIYNMFISALGAKTVGQTKLYDTIIKYVITKLETMGYKVDYNKETEYELPLG